MPAFKRYPNHLYAPKGRYFLKELIILVYELA
jgi:hypothetical protein